MGTGDTGRSRHFARVTGAAPTHAWRAVHGSAFAGSLGGKHVGGTSGSPSRASLWHLCLEIGRTGCGSKPHGHPSISEGSLKAPHRRRRLPGLGPQVWQRGCGSAFFPGVFISLIHGSSDSLIPHATLTTVCRALTVAPWYKSTLISPPCSTQAAAACTSVICA